MESGSCKDEAGESDENDHTNKGKCRPNFQPGFCKVSNDMANLGKTILPRISGENWPHGQPVEKHVHDHVGQNIAISGTSAGRRKP